MEILAVIPARSGSRSVKDKNIRIMNGKPMIAYSIEQALAAQHVTRVIVSTDSQRYADIAKSYGAEAPFLRPKECSGDDALDIQVFQHALRWLKENEQYGPKICVHLRPTHPIRDPKDIDRMIEMLLHDPSLDSVRSVARAVQTPYKMWLFEEGSSLLSPVAACGIDEAYNAPRQRLPAVYMQNACIDVIRTETITQMHSMTGKRIAGYRMDHDYDIDTETDLIRAEQAQLLRKAMETGKRLRICCDIDGIIAQKTQGGDYGKAGPIQKNIDIINRLYELGHEVILFTARGYATGIDWRALTEDQLKKWGVEYERLLFGKPDADLYIDDRSAALELFEMYRA